MIDPEDEVQELPAEGGEEREGAKVSPVESQEEDTDEEESDDERITPEDFGLRSYQT